MIDYLAVDTATIPCNLGTQSMELIYEICSRSVSMKLPS